MPDKIVGRHSVLEVLRHGNREIERILIAQGKGHPRLRQIQSIAEKKGIRCDFVLRRELDQIEATVPHQGVIALVSPTSYTDLQTIISSAQNVARVPILIMLDQIQDPRNLGAIIRIADAVRADGVIIPKHKAAGVTTSAHKTSAGSSEYVPIAQVTNLARTIETLKAAGIWVIGADQDASTPYTQADLTVPVCLVLGSEAEGLRRLVKEKCDLLVHLPMFGHVPSLNVSVTAGVLLYEVVRQRGNA
ncbi:MAG: 23S rRNA (guanosine(2251)-2'-O)-methyltransferase RlmB [Candidatus Poribacteria bacterium]|nr:23S rRNA (guanosine(2251)-2'-O)-methyltransferase RlmB [Candidatus Poribacteria bacterium]